VDALECFVQYWTLHWLHAIYLSLLKNSSAFDRPRKAYARRRRRELEKHHQQHAPLDISADARSVLHDNHALEPPYCAADFGGTPAPPSCSSAEVIGLHNYRPLSSPVLHRCRPRPKRFTFGILLRRTKLNLLRFLDSHSPSPKRVRAKWRVLLAFLLLKVYETTHTRTRAYTHQCSKTDTVKLQRSLSLFCNFKLTCFSFITECNKKTVSL